MDYLSVIKEINELFINIPEFAKICYNIDIKKLKINHFETIHTPYPYIIYWSEIEFSESFSIKQIFAALFLIDLYYCEEWGFDEEIPLSALEEFWIPSYLYESREHKLKIKQIDTKTFFDDFKWYMEQTNQPKEKIENLKQDYKESFIITTFDNYCGNEYFGINKTKAFLCDFGHYD